MSLSENPDVFQTITSADDPINHEGNIVNGNCESSYDEETDLIDSGEHDSMPMWKAAANFICDVEGTGLLGLPFAVLNGGVAALAALIVVPVICCYTGTIMIQCLYGNSSTPGGRKPRLRSSIEELGGSLLAWNWKKGGSSTAKHRVTYAVSLVPCPLWYIPRLRIPHPEIY